MLGVANSVDKGEIVMKKVVVQVGGSAVGVATPSKEPDGMREGDTTDVPLFTPGVYV